jgi:hypothetical protein
MKPFLGVLITKLTWKFTFIVLMESSQRLIAKGTRDRAFKGETFLKESSSRDNLLSKVDQITSTIF